MVKYKYTKITLNFHIIEYIIYGGVKMGLEGFLKMISGVAWIVVFWIVVILIFLFLYNKFFRKK
ncbi:hypothetical protein SAMN04487969_13543 [Paenibacillus algorifonticola]|uniref:Uncharacterized protein n=1 Tax=Paenibacillus algorifonticola TaxID=684063 RepID=A0A1I2IHJ0_9BACL|nr:hypothetical protein SAMN04487969_13543 [Paenibacillus algorifonticola]